MIKNFGFESFAVQTSRCFAIVLCKRMVPGECLGRSAGLFELGCPLRQLLTEQPCTSGYGRAKAAQLAARKHTSKVNDWSSLELYPAGFSSPESETFCRPSALQLRIPSILCLSQHKQTQAVLSSQLVHSVGFYVLCNSSLQCLGDEQKIGT